MQWKREDQSWSVCIYFVSVLVSDCINEFVCVVRDVGELLIVNVKLFRLLIIIIILQMIWTVPVSCRKSKPLTESFLFQDPSLIRTQTKHTQCDWNCTAELDPDLLIQGERYEARVRAEAAHDWADSTWSEWGPTTSWVSLVGKTKPPPSSG